MPQHRVAILGFPRTGTNYLATSLGSLPGVTFHPEPFNPASVHLAEGVRDALKAERDADPLGFLDRIGRDCATPVLGIKLLPNHAPAERADGAQPFGDGHGGPGRLPYTSAARE